MKPRNLLLGASVLGLAAMLFTAGASHSSASSTSPQVSRSTTNETPASSSVAESMAPERRPDPRLPPRFESRAGYVPKGFDPAFREHIVDDLAADIDAKLGKDFPAWKRKEVARIQNEFWDEHGPNVDAFRDGLIDQPEFAQRTHEAMAGWSQKFGDLLTDSEHERLFDVPRYTDVYPLLFHSASEQPGMPFQPENNGGQLASADQPPIPTQPPAPAPTPTPTRTRIPSASRDIDSTSVPPR